MRGILSDIRVTAFTHYAAGPLTAQYIGAFGADVIKIEAPTTDLNRYAVRDPDGRFDGISPYFFTLNRNQRTIALNLKTAEGRGVAQKLVERSDLIIENYRPGVLDKLGFGYEQVRKVKPNVIYCSISAYDLLGPSRGEPGQDLIIQSLSGLAMLTGRSDSPPVPLGTYAVDAYTSMNCVAGILAAIRHRDKTGEGQWVRVDMMSAALHMMAQEASYALNVSSEFERSRSGVAHVHQGAPYAIYRTADGALAMSISSVTSVRSLADKLEILSVISGLLSERGLFEHRDEIVAAIAGALERRLTAEALELAASCGIICAPVRSLQEALQDPAIQACGAIRETRSGYGGSYRVVVEPLKMDASPLEFTCPAPAFGQHSREVLAELGLENEEIDRLVASGAVLEKNGT